MQIPDNALNPLILADLQTQSPPELGDLGGECSTRRDNEIRDNEIRDDEIYSHRRQNGSARGAFSKLLQLSPKDILLLLKTFLLLHLIRLGLLLLPFPSLQQRIGNLQSDRQNHLQAVQRPHPPVSQLVWAVQVCSRYTPGGVLCLARALTTQALLYQAGHACALRIGVTKPGSSPFLAHAWVESEGKVVIGDQPNLAQFMPLL